MPLTDCRVSGLESFLHAGTLVLTGAGVSTDSGIPDYRGPGAPVRTPMLFGDFLRDPAARQRYWARSHLGWQRMATARPNVTHHALAAAQAAGLWSGLITQNVDGLHHLAGHHDVIDLHGRLDRVVCLDCRRVSPRSRLQERLSRANHDWDEPAIGFAPDGDALLADTAGFIVVPCEHCGGVLKPDVVFFGESVPKDRVAQCSQLVDHATALLVLGSSLQVLSGLRFVRQARKRGIPIAIVNRGATRGDDLADIKIDAGCAQTLVAVPAIAHALAAVFPGSARGDQES